MFRSQRTLLRVLLALCGATAGAAWAQDVELYDQPGFNGLRLTLTSNVGDLNAYGIGRRTSSVVVQRGQWEFCTQPNFGGACITVGPGRYPDLPGGLKGQLISVRNVGAAGQPPQPQQPPPQPQRPQQPVPPAPYPAPPQAPYQPPYQPPPGYEPVTLFSEPDFSGTPLGVSQPTTHLSQRSYNDLARSVEIRRGRWQLCQHSDYAGECIVLGPGRHVLPGRLAGGLSSLRPVWGPNQAPLPQHGGVVLYQHSDFQGQELFVGQAVPNLSTMNFNDKTSSIEIMGGRWEFCTDADYGGRCFTLTPGRYNLERALNDRLSSLRPR